jgi:sugar phosphate permease
VVHDFGCYIVYHYSLRFDKRVVHVVVVVILCTITVLGLTEEWFMLLLFCLTLLFKIWQRSGACCCCYIVYHYCSIFDRGVVDVVVVILPTITVQGFTEEWFMFCLLNSLPSLFTVLQRSGSCCCCYIVYHYCFRFDRVVHVLGVILSTITV